MKKIITVLLASALFTTGIAQDNSYKPYGEVTSKKVETFTMLGWGVGLAVAIAVACIVVKNSRS